MSEKGITGREKHHCSWNEGLGKRNRVPRLSLDYEIKCEGVKQEGKTWK